MLQLNWSTCSLHTVDYLINNRIRFEYEYFFLKRLVNASPHILRNLSENFTEAGRTSSNTIYYVMLQNFALSFRNWQMV
jgi:hypothetical protein